MGNALSRTLKPFGSRLQRMGIAPDVTQEELGRKSGLSNRMVAYHEIHSGTPSPAEVFHFAEALGASADKLVGSAVTRNGSAELAPQTSAELRLWRRRRKVQELPRPQRRAFLKFLDGFLAQDGLAERP